PLPCFEARVIIYLFIFRLLLTAVRARYRFGWACLPSFPIHNHPTVPLYRRSARCAPSITSIDLGGLAPPSLRAPNTIRPLRPHRRLVRRHSPWHTTRGHLRL
ncbi:unnamed protein product, partial [Laminaria digitata]